MMQRVTLLLLVMGVVLPRTAMALRYSDSSQVIDLGGQWLFQSGDNPTFARNKLDDFTWLERQLPVGETEWAERWSGFAWYRLHVYVGPKAAASDLMLSLGPLGEVVEVYVNGAIVATRGQFAVPMRVGPTALPLMANLPRGILHDGDNVIAIRVFDPSYRGGATSGPILMGPPGAIRARVHLSMLASYGARLLLGLMALFIGVSQLLIQVRRGGERDGWWLVGTGICLAGVHLAGTGIYSLLPSVEAAVRLPTVLSCLTILCMTHLFGSRFEDIGARGLKWGRALLLVIAALILLLPQAWVYFGIPPLLMLSGLIGTLYSAHLCIQAIRRGEEGTVPVFIGLCLLATLIVYDGWTAKPSDILPPFSVMGALGVLCIAVVTGARQSLLGNHLLIQRVQTLTQQLEAERTHNLIEAYTLLALQPAAFLSHAIQEIAQELEVRRCSLIIMGTDDQLRIRSSVGLPQHIKRTVVPAGSIAQRVYEKGVAITSGTVSIKADGSRGKYQTNAFMALPVKDTDGMLGVLNFSDRNNGGRFRANDEVKATKIANKMALLLTHLPRSVFEPPQSEDDTEIPEALDTGNEVGEQIASKAKQPPAEQTHTEEDLSALIMEEDLSTEFPQETLGEVALDFNDVGGDDLKD